MTDFKTSVSDPSSVILVSKVDRTEDDVIMPRLSTTQGLTMELISRQDAKLLGLVRYFTGEPCSRGHICERMTRNHECVECRNFAKRGFREAMPASEKKDGTYYDRNKELVLAKAKAKRDAKKVPEQLWDLAAEIEAIVQTEPPKRLGYTSSIGGVPLMPLEDARVLGLNKYFTGVPCVNGHVCEQYTANSNCVKCRAMRGRAKRMFATEQEKAHKREQDRRSWRRKHGAHGFQYWCNLLDTPRKMDDPGYRKEVARKRVERFKARYHSEPEYAEGVRRYYREYNRVNNHRLRPIRNYHHAQRRTLKANAMPSWLSKEDKRKMRGMYFWAKFLGELHGEPYHVDHIYPIKHPEMCGLHVPWNLQVIPATVNLRKHNSLPEHFDVNNCVKESV